MKYEKRHNCISISQIPKSLLGLIRSSFPDKFAAAMEEGKGSSEMEFTNIDTAADALDSSAIFHVVTDILGFVLFMHQQIPS